MVPGTTLLFSLVSLLSLIFLVNASAISPISSESHSNGKRVVSFIAHRVIFESTLSASAIIASIEKEIRRDVYDDFDFGTLAVPSILANNETAFAEMVATKTGPLGLMCVTYSSSSWANRALMFGYT